MPQGQWDLCCLFVVTCFFQQLPPPQLGSKLSIRWNMPLSKRIYDSKEVGLDCDEWVQIFSALILKPNQLFKKQWYLYFTVLQFCRVSYNTKKKNHSRLELQELEWTNWIFHALHMIIFTSELGNSLLFFLFFTNSSQLLFALKGFNALRSPLKIFMLMQNRIASFFIHIILLYLFLPGCWCSSAGPVWSDFHQLRSESLVLCLLCCPIRASPRRKLSPQVHHGWWEMKRKEEVTWALP